MLMPRHADAAYELSLTIPVKVGMSEIVVALLCLLITIWFNWDAIRRRVAEHLLALAHYVSPDDGSSAPTGEVPKGERRYFVSPAGLCVHVDKACRGLRTVSNGNKRSLRLCKHCCPDDSGSGSN